MSLGSTVGALRDAGYAVVVFSPEQLAGVPPAALEKHLFFSGLEFIGDQTDEGETNG